MMKVVLQKIEVYPQGSIQMNHPIDNTIKDLNERVITRLKEPVIYIKMIPNINLYPNVSPKM